MPVVLAVLALRIIVPFFILKKPFWGWIAALLADGLDSEIVRQFAPEYTIDYNQYQKADKVLDLYMSAFAVYASAFWAESLARSASYGLFAWRLLGVILFEIIGARILLLVFANVFEFFFLFYSYTRAYLPEFTIRTKKRLVLLLLVLSIPKLAQEYLLHILEARPWIHLKYEIFKWPR